MLAVGFILIVLDVHLYTGINYPSQYANSDSVIGEFQYYTLYSTYGARCTYKMISSGTTSAQDNALSNSDTTATSTEQTVKVIDKVFFKTIRIDIFNDFIGFILIGFACFKLRMINRNFRYSLACAVSGFLLNAIMAALPFAVNGLLLCNITLVVGIAYLACNLVTVFLFVSGLLHMFPDICCRDERKWCKIIWFISFVLQIMVTFVFWIGSDFTMLYHLGCFFEIVLILDIIIFWRIIHRVTDYIQASYNKSVSVS
jgi:hypothetical protein